MHTFPPQLLKEIRSGRCIAFVGAGFSGAARLPSWNGLLQEMARHEALAPAQRQQVEELLQHGTRPTNDEAAQVLEDVLTRPVFVTELQKRLGHPKVPAAMKRRMEWLVGIPFRAVLTTNFDGLIDGMMPGTDAYREVLRPAPLPWWSQLYWTSDHRPPVVKIHGDVRDPGTIVLTRRDYRRLLYRDPYYRDFLRAVLVHHTVLYLGFSFRDAYLNELRSETLALLDYDLGLSPVAYAIINDVPDFTQEHYRKHEGIEILSYDTKGGTDFSGFDHLLRALHEQTNPLFHFGSLLKGRRMLWLDPQPDNNQDIVHFLHWAKEQARVLERDFQLDTASTVSEGLAFLKGAQGEHRPYDLLITHWGYSPGQTSTAEEILLEMRRQDLRCPVLIFSIHGPDIDARKRQALALGAQAYCFNSEALLRNIERILSPGEETG